MNWFTPVDNYCERLSPGFWAEPLNAVSNLSFIIAGLLLLVQWRQGPRTIMGLLLCLNVLVIGIGSFLFHTFANRWSELADVLPITVFIHMYFLLALHRFLGLKWWIAPAATLALFAASPVIGQALAPLMGSSAFYAPAMMAIFGVALAARQKDPAASAALFAAGCIFALSLAYRAADLALCDLHPQGTHARWHLLNGALLYILVHVYLRLTATPAAR
jgi:hypothetical protein